MKNRVFVILDEAAGEACVRLLDIPDRLYGEAAAETWGILWGEDAEAYKGYFDSIIAIPCEEQQLHDIRWRASCVEALFRGYGCQCMIFPASRTGRMLAPAVAMKLETGIVADVVDVRLEGGRIQMIRPTFDGKMMAVIENQGGHPVVMSARPEAFSYQCRDKETVTRLWKPDIPCRGKICLTGRRKAGDHGDITKAETLVSMGGGYGGKPEDLEELARELGGMVSSGRKPVDEGRAPRSIQVGQSGHVVSPRLYIALGIKGAIQHMVGLKDAGHIIAVNTDRDAPICSRAEIVVTGDAGEFAEKLLEKLRQGRQREI